MSSKQYRSNHVTLICVKTTFFFYSCGHCQPTCVSVSLTLEYRSRMKDRRSSYLTNVTYVCCNPITGLNRPWAFQKIEAPRFQDIRHMKVVRLSAVRTGRLFFPRKYFWYSCLLEDKSTPVRLEGLCQRHHRKSNPRPTGSYRIASTNCTTGCPTVLESGLNCWDT
jgi:hypothetical protein